MSQHFGLEVSDGGDAMTLLVRGDIDLATAPGLLESIVCASLSHTPGHVIVDVSRVSFIDSRGLSALIEARGRLAAEGARLDVVNVPTRILHLMRVAGIADLLQAAPHPTAELAQA
ncbi:MAG: STAS domain-containing protein [Acidimicrobiales bacterium]